MEKIIVSACLLGDKCRYDGHSNYVPLIKELKEKYKYILAEIHDAYLGKKDLSKEEKRRITAITELMTVPKDFDLDMEYMLIDLNLKSALVDFDLDLFVESSKGFIDGCDHRSDLVNFSSVLYILVYKNIFKIITFRICKLIPSIKQVDSLQFEINRFSTYKYFIMLFICSTVAMGQSSRM